MADILVRGLDDDIAARLKEKARRGERSLNDLVKDVLSEAARPSREEFWAKVKSLRDSMGPMPDDSTALIREDRDR